MRSRPCRTHLLHGTQAPIMTDRASIIDQAEYLDAGGKIEPQGADIGGVIPDTGATIECDIPDTGDLWPRTPQVEAIYGVSERTAQWWAVRYDCAVMVPREDDAGGWEYRYYRPVLKRCRVLG